MVPTPPAGRHCSPAVGLRSLCNDFLLCNQGGIQETLEEKREEKLTAPVRIGETTELLKRATT